MFRFTAKHMDIDMSKPYSPWTHCIYAIILETNYQNIARVQCVRVHYRSYRSLFMKENLE